MSKLFGANWQTTLWGGIFALATAISLTPAIINFLPDGIEGYVRGFAALIIAVSGAKFAQEAKSRNVTGGTVQQTIDGLPAEPGTQTLVDATVKASIESGEDVSPEQRAAVTNNKRTPK